MGRTARDRRPYAPPVQKIELSARHAHARLALAALLLVIGAACLTYALCATPGAKAGWAQIEAASGEANCSGDFTFLYPLGTGGSPTAERKALTLTYSDACVDAYQLFTDDAEFDGLANPRYLNAHPNEELPLDPALYRAFEQIARSGDRGLYLAPIREVYDNIFRCADPAQTAEFDPRQNEALREWFARVCAYANDPAQVNLELLGDGRARLRVSDEYLAFARAEEIGSFIDFGWMRNAFVADYLAGRLADAGYRIGTLSSNDGFMRNLDELSDADYAIDLPARDGEGIHSAATLHYRGARAIVSLRDFPTGPADAARCAPLPDGSFATAYLDPADGLCKSAAPSLTAYSEAAGCAEIALRLSPIYIAEALDEGALATLAQSGIQSIRCEDGAILCTEDGVQLTNLEEE